MKLPAKIPKPRKNSTDSVHSVLFFISAVVAA